MRTLPRASGKDSLDTLATRQTTHARVRNQLGVETKVGAVRLNLLADERAELTRGKSLLHINIGNHLLVRGQKLVTGQPGVVSRHHGNPTLVLHANVLTKGERALILVRVLELSAAVDANDATLSALNSENLVHGLLIILGDDLVGTVHGLTILASLETPLDILGRSLVQVIINVGESVLLDVGNADVLVLVDLTLGGNKFTGKNIDQGRLASTVGTNDGNTALECDVGDLGLGGSGVLEGHLGGTENSLGLGLDTLKETGLGERELNLGGTELVVGLGRGNTLDKLHQVAPVALELVALVVDNVLADVVKEARVVGDNDGSARGVNQVLLEPLDILDIQMVGWLVKQENIGSFENGTTQGELHLPTTGKGRDLTLDHLLGEAKLVETGLDFSLAGLDTGFGKLLHGPVNGSHFSILRVQVVLDEDGLDFALLGETLNLLVVDGTHEGRLARTIGTAKTVALTTLETEVSLVEQNLGTVGKREGAVAEILTLVIIWLTLGLGSGSGRGLLADGVDNGLGIVNAGDDGNVGLEVLDPDAELKLLLIDELASDSGNVLGNGAHLGKVVAVLGSEDVLDLGKDDVEGTVILGLGDDTVLDVTDTGKGVERLLGLFTGLGVSQVVVVLLETGHHLGQEGSNNVGVVDELAHVVDNDGGFTLDGSLTLGKTTVEKGNHKGKSRFLDLGDKGGGTEQVNSLRDIFRLGDTLDELGNEALNILVDDELAELLHGLVGAILDLLLGVPHGLGNDGNELRDADGELSGRAGHESVNEVESGHLLSPLLGVADRLHDGDKGGLDSVGVDGTSNGKNSSAGGVLDSGGLVTDGGKKGREKDNKVGLDVSGNLGVRGNGLNGNGSLFTGGSILFVGEALGDVVNDPVKCLLAMRTERNT
ncbi:hypothetical protein CRV24_007176 [Beauveria bassiana]|nr:hypothetical protein CRV24_007176 [Beauveria bassiana]KAH8712655.1 hypothetical protein HC256_005835 [Beauveria bassiana]